MPRAESPPDGNRVAAPVAARVGLTGGIGSGKTTVAGCFAGLGVQVIDADQIARDICEPGSAPFAQILECFGADLVDSRGRLERKRLGQIAFASAEKRQQLEAILHPPIRREMVARARRDERPYCVLDIPLLVETAQYREMERVLVVSCARAERIRRLRQRGMTHREIERVLRAQASERQRKAVADDLIDNNGAIEDIEPQVRALHAKYLELFAGSDRGS